jgi:hypothetical protein
MQTSRWVATAAALSVSIAVALAGCAGPAPGETAAPSSSPRSSATATATPRAEAPTSRVPATCDELVPAGDVAAAFRLPVSPYTAPVPRSPAAYADARAGVLTCAWASAERFSETTPTLYGWVTVVPQATREAVDAMLAGGMFGEHAAMPVAPDSYSSCGPDQFQWCGFIGYGEQYSVIGGVWDYGDGTYDTQSAVIQSLAADVIPAARALPAPAPLWQPVGPTLTGAQDCDGLLTNAQAAEAAGLSDAHPVKSDDGENALSTLGINHQVGSYSCFWAGGSGSDSVSAAVLPGGASFATATRPADAVDVPGLGEAAFRSGDDLDVIADGGWVQVGGSAGISAEALEALARQVLANVGYEG